MTPTPTPGHHYLVPCYRGTAVLLPAHRDLETPDAGLHLHIDRRFEDVPEGWVFHNLPRQHKITLERKRCRTNSPSAWRHHDVEWMEVDHYDCRVGRDGRCPHQGLSVRAGRQLADSSWVCPGHGLRWSRDGALIRGAAADHGLWSLAGGVR